MALGLLSIEAPCLWQGPTEETEEKGLWEREFPSRQKAGQQQVSTMSTHYLEGALRSAPGRGLVVLHDRGLGGGRKGAATKPLDKQGPLPRASLFQKDLVV